MGLFGWTFLAMFVLKLTHYIDWSWYVVTSPLWAGFLVVFSIVVFKILIGAK